MGLFQDAKFARSFAFSPSWQISAFFCFFLSPNWATKRLLQPRKILKILPHQFCLLENVVLQILVLDTFYYLIHKCLNRDLRDPNCVFLHNEITRSNMLLPSINLLCTLHKIQIRWLCMHAYFTFSTLLKKWAECWKGCFAVRSIQILGTINLKAYDLLFFARNKLSPSCRRGWLHLLQFRSQYLDKDASGCAGKRVCAGSSGAGRISSVLPSYQSWNLQLILWHRFSS